MVVSNSEYWKILFSSGNCTSLASPRDLIIRTGTVKAPARNGRTKIFSVSFSFNFAIVILYKLNFKD